ncbi:uncharacterized protein LOC117669218 isoform X2 [Pantherophis guttatus]|uniref:Uncharacterized protein LOC117669218 isoform X2 n=1 Tax=Pantherophis guttatus TaxID=94885 RepID=A0A6P9CHQ2_PANGU|nr:uncharacterized protein LOC117669218 isoform X2 [Pantherophis guttatus]
MEPVTVGGLMRTLREMGFSEEQVGAALRAGCLSVPEAADWLLRDRPEGVPHSPRLRLFPGVSEPRATDAFQAPRTPHLVDGTGAAELPGGVPAAPGGDGQPQAWDLADRSQLVQQLKTEKRTKQRERELALQRIADDRRQNRARAATPQPGPGCAQPDAIQPPGRAQCLLVIRLPSGESLRRTFPAEASLQSVQRFLRSQHPGLSPSSAFLQAAPKRRFGPADLPHSLLALGLAPGATLCVVEPAPGDASPPCPAPPEPLPAEGSPCSQGAGKGAEPTPGTPQEGLSSRGGKVPSRDPHRWAVLPAARDDPAESGHWWPQEGHRLRREAEGSSPGPLPLAVARAAEQRHCQTPVLGESSQLASASPAALVSPSVPSLFGLCLQGAAALLSAPSRQYRGSLASLPPGLAQVLLEYLVRGARLHPGSLRLFSGCSLWTLCLDCYPYATNRLLAELPAFPGLRQLSLFCCSLITDQGLSVVQHLSHLQQLNLSACAKLTDNCLPFLKGLLELSHLVLDQTRVTDAGLAGFLLGSPSALSHLSLNRTSVTERTLLLLPQCAPQLRELGLKQTGISDVSALRHSEALQRLFLDGTPVSEASLRTLASHPALGCLTLSAVQSVDGDRVLELVSALPLTQLALPSRHTVTNLGLAAVCRLSGLLELDLTDYIHITDEGLQPLPGLCRLRCLSLANTRVTDDGLCHVRPLQLLEQLRLDRLPVSSAGVAHCVRGLRHLQVLSLASTAVGDPVARLGLAECRHLLKLNLSDTCLTDRGLRFLAQLPLVQLNVDGSGVTAAGVAELVATCPTLARVRSGRLRLLSPAEEEEEPGD